MKLTKNTNKVRIEHIHMSQPFVWEKREDGAWINNFGKLFTDVKDMQAMLTDADNAGYQIYDISEDVPKIEITSEAVKAAYEKTGLNPVNTVFHYINEEKQHCACGMTALAWSVDPDKMQNVAITKYTSIVDTIAEILEIETYEVWAFAKGFDSLEEASDIFKDKFYEVGYESRKLVFNES